MKFCDKNLMKGVPVYLKPRLLYHARSEVQLHSLHASYIQSSDKKSDHLSLDNHTDSRSLDFIVGSKRRDLYLYKIELEFQCV